MDRVLSLVVRWRLAVLLVALAGSAGFEIGQRMSGYEPGLMVEVVVQLLVPFGLVFSSGAMARKHHPAVLVARPPVPAVEAPGNPWLVLGAVGYTVLGSRTLGNLTEDVVTDGDFWFWTVVVGFWLLFMAVFWTAALGRFGVRLTPDGIVDRQFVSSLFVPWDALEAPLPAFAFDTQQVTLSVADAGRVRRRGLRFGHPAVLPAAGVNAELLARAIHEYVNRPDLRPMIGTEEELDRFRAIPQVAALTAGR